MKKKMISNSIHLTIIILLIICCDGSNAGNIETETATDTEISDFAEAINLRATDLAVIARDDVCNAKTTIETLMKAAHSGKIVIAASNADSNSKAGADYICDGNDDEDQISDAIKDLYDRTDIKEVLLNLLRANLILETLWN